MDHWLELYRDLQRKSINPIHFHFYPLALAHADRKPLGSEQGWIFDPDGPGVGEYYSFREHERPENRASVLKAAIRHIEFRLVNEDQGRYVASVYLS